MDHYRVEDKIGEALLLSLASDEVWPEQQGWRINAGALEEDKKGRLWNNDLNLSIVVIMYRRMHSLCPSCVGFLQI